MSVDIRESSIISCIALGKLSLLHTGPSMITRIISFHFHNNLMG